MNVWLINIFVWKSTLGIIISLTIICGLPFILFFSNQLLCCGTSTLLLRSTSFLSRFKPLCWFHTAAKCIPKCALPWFLLASEETWSSSKASGDSRISVFVVQISKLWKQRLGWLSSGTTKNFCGLDKFRSESTYIAAGKIILLHIRSMVAELRRRQRNALHRPHYI